jgi:uncharacterized protein
MLGLDGSHDFLHIERVMNLAETLARMEGVADIELVKLGALLHDLEDWKYSGSETAGPEKARSWLLSQQFDKERTEKVVEIIECIGFKNELGLTKEEAAVKAAANPALAVVQDADRLDALGAIGIARAFTFGGAKHRPLHDPTSTESVDSPMLTKDQYVKRPSNGATVQHFYEKLLHLKDLMKTPSGKKLAEERHKYMEAFLEQFLAEWAGSR